MLLKVRHGISQGSLIKFSHKGAQQLLSSVNTIMGYHASSMSIHHSQTPMHLLALDKLQIEEEEASEAKIDQTSRQVNFDLLLNKDLD